MHGKRIINSYKPLVILSALMFMIGFWGGLYPAESGFLERLLAFSGGKASLTWYIPGQGSSDSPLVSWYKETLKPAAVFSKGGVPFAYALAATAEPETSLPYGDLDEPSPAENEVKLPATAAEEDPIGNPGAPLVAVYCSHNAECYAATSGVARMEGKNGGVYQVAKELKTALQKEGISAVLCDTIHDYPDWSLSYQNSLASMKKMKEQYPSLEIFIDVHRDVKLAQSTTVYKTKDGETAAKLMLIVGSNKRLEHPNWQENLSFSQKVGAELEAKFPGIMRGVRVQSGRYNQHFSPEAILVEVGSTENTLTQAKKSADMLADALKAVIADQ